MIAQFSNNAIKKFNNRQIYGNLEKLQLFEVTLKMRRLKACNFRLLNSTGIRKIIVNEFFEIPITHFPSSVSTHPLKSSMASSFDFPS